jgi:chaperone required for assembly of F1-ATPase
MMLRLGVLARASPTSCRCGHAVRPFSAASASDRVKRFYKHADIAPAKDGSGRFVVTLDGRTLKTPDRTEVILPTEAAAVAVAAEWESQEKHVMPHLMPLTRLTMTAIDVVPKQRQSIIDGIMPYLDTDTVWFWEDAERYSNSKDLYALQQEKYTPILDWMEGRFGARPEVTTGLFVEQPEELISGVRAWTESLDVWQLAALDQSVRSLKSMALAVALLHYHLSPEEAATASRLEEFHQINEWCVPTVSLPARAPVVHAAASAPTSASSRSSRL